MTGEWTSERVSALMALWKEGLPTSEIGRRLGVTKNAVVGKVHRLGLPKRQSPIRDKPDAVKVIKMDGLSAGMCSWPEGDPGTETFRFCGEPAIVGKPYCGAHCAKAYVKNTRDRSSSTAVASSAA